jgi:hypothetical protein
MAILHFVQTGQARQPVPMGEPGDASLTMPVLPIVAETPLLHVVRL